MLWLFVAVTSILIITITFICVFSASLMLPVYFTSDPHVLYARVSLTITSHGPEPRLHSQTMIACISRSLPCFKISLSNEPTTSTKANRTEKGFDKREVAVQVLVNRMNVAELIKELDMVDGNGFVRGETAGYPGSIHDFYPPDADVANAVQREAGEIPVLFIEECLHGLMRDNHSSFPHPIAMANTFDVDLVKRIGRAIGAESRAYGVHSCLSPCLDLARDPRYGRVEETFGEDPYLVSQLAVAIVTGMQNDGDLRNETAVVATVKHFVGHGHPAGGRNVAPVQSGKRDLFSSHMVPFREAVAVGGARSVMGAYSEVDGVPSIANSEHLTKILRNSWGFDGFVVSDLGAIGMLVWTHSTAESVTDAIAQYLNAGGNVQFYDFSHDDWRNGILRSLETGDLKIEVLKERVSELVRLKYDLGLLKNRYTSPDLVARYVNSAPHQALALEAAEKSIVLLKNNGILPLSFNSVSKTRARIALIGPNAAIVRMGDYSSEGGVKNGVSVAEALAKHVPKSDIFRVAGTNIKADSSELQTIPSYLLTHKNKKGEFLPGLVARYYNGGEADQDKLAFKRIDPEIAFEWYHWAPREMGVVVKSPVHFTVVWEGFFTPDVETVSDGWIGVDLYGSWESSADIYIDDVLVATSDPNLAMKSISNSNVKNGIVIDVESSSSEGISINLENEPFNRFFEKKKLNDAHSRWQEVSNHFISVDGHYNSSEKFDTRYFHRKGQMLVRRGGSFTVPANFVKDKKYAIKIVYRKVGRRGGIRLVWNAVGADGITKAKQIAAVSDIAIVVVGDTDSTSGETFDRTTLDLIGNQGKLINEVQSTGTPTIVVSIHGRPLAYTRELLEYSNVHGLLTCFYPGQAQGTAIVNVLFGVVSPSGRLSVSLPRNPGQLPIYYDQKPTGAIRHHAYLDDKNHGPYPGAALLPFGFGLSYTRFEYEDFQASTNQIRVLGSCVDEDARRLKGYPCTQPAHLRFSVHVKNVGAVVADDIVQVYAVNDGYGRAVGGPGITVPARQLVAFARVGNLTPGESRVVAINIEGDVAKWLAVWWDKDVEKLRITKRVRRFALGKNSEDLLLWTDVNVV
ncbi:hypothetical protein HK096_007609 [Nowakowskiella sp. JEL0078]|nr:hypothetical protein HK096_007609 [Nowakowskiella sp. JEL0078]